MHSRVPPPRAALAVGLAAFLGYVLTVLPGPAGGDCGELAAAAYTMGVPHPTGYPLYMLLARSWLWLFPFGAAALRLNVLSALCAAGAAGALFLVHRALGRDTLPAAALALFFAWSPTVWSQSVVTEVYPLQLLLAALFLLALARWAADGAEVWLYALALLAGVQLAHHLTSVFVVVAGALVVAVRWRSVPWRRVAGRAALLAALPLALYLYLLVRSLADPPVDWGNPGTLAALYRHATGRQYGSKLFPVRWPDIAANAKFIGDTLRADLPFGLSLAGVSGVVLAAVRRRPFGLGLAGLAIAQGAFCLAYRVQDLGAFIVPLLLAVNLGLGEALGAVAAPLARRVGPRARLVARVALLAGTAGFGALTAARLPRDAGFLSVSYAADILDSLPHRAQFLSEGDFRNNGLLYAQVLEQRRTDVAVFAQGGDLFQGYHPPLALTPRIFMVDAAGTFLPGYERHPYGLVLESRLQGTAAGPEPWAAYRPIPAEEDLRRIGERDAHAAYLLVTRLYGRWSAARDAGEPAAGRIARELYEAGRRFTERIVPREEEFRFMMGLAAGAEEWQGLIDWSGRLEAVAALDARHANNLAWANLQLGKRLDLAESYARRAVALDPGSGTFHDTLASVLVAAGKREEGDAAMRRALELAPDDPEVRADALRLLGAGRVP